MQNIEQLLNRENWVKYLRLAIEGGLTDVAIANDIVAHIKEALSIGGVVGQSEQCHCELYAFGINDKPCDKQCDGCKAMNLD